MWIWYDFLMLYRITEQTLVGKQLQKLLFPWYGMYTIKLNHYFLYDYRYFGPKV